MNIIMVGCGKVGYSLVEQLSKEDHNITVIDEDAEEIRNITNNLDALGIVGNAVSFTTLQEADVAHADLLIAVTGSDEQNLLCCLIAKRSGHCKTIARVRNPLYVSEIEFLKKGFDLGMIINPEFEAANEIARIFQFPSAVKVDTFARGHVDMLHIKLTQDSPLNGLRIMDIRSTLHTSILICSVTRDGHTRIPNGGFVLQEGDEIGFTARRKETTAFLRKIGLSKNRIDNAIIAGGSKIAFYLARLLMLSGINTTIIEQKRERCEQLAELLPDVAVIHGDATDQNLLLQENVSTTAGFAALTGLDEENILLSLYVKGINPAAKVITKINRITFSDVINQMNLDTIINPQVITADFISRFVRSMDNTDSEVENLYKLADGQAEALEFVIKEDSNATNTPLAELSLKDNLLICCIYRNGQIIFPTGQDCLKVGDSVVVVLSGFRISDIKGILKD
ncbi:MAG: Trk system potassium transporter TrkA [Lachnospiraceae bacterium]|nr:Trk system potassium transporter TrkA [Lachnospiraceae bacterium]